MRTLLLLLCFLLPPQIIGATQNVETLLNGWNSDSSKLRNQATQTFLSQLTPQYEPLCKKLINRVESSNNPEWNSRLESLLEKIYRRFILHEGVSEIGLTLGWFIEMNEDNIPSTRPLVIDVAKGSPAEAAGFVKGDVILTLNKKNQRSVDSRNRLVKELAQTPPNTLLTFNVKNATKDRDKAYDIYHKNWKGTRKLKTVALAKTKQTTKLDQKAFTAWKIKLSN